ncbi:hypothetical protein [Nocardia abscessus]|uniref:hypothetical protein n=1 Tax=Nocardia abscessus TaxID=120957 RepID=UPI00245403A7|nr:hypothetical protein [Nocardia abscessus]
MDTKTTEYVSTDRLRQGDVLLHHGMRLVIDQPIESYDSAGTGEKVYRTAARIDNWDQLVERAKTDRTIAGFIVSQSPNQRWAIQGNRLARWTREIASPTIYTFQILGEDGRPVGGVLITSDKEEADDMAAHYQATGRNYTLTTTEYGEPDRITHSREDCLYPHGCTGCVSD